jgi:hypothetical protein
MMVERRWPTWKLFAMFGDEYSMTTFFPAPEVFVPYSGEPDGGSFVSSCTCISTARMREGVFNMKCKNALSCVTDST